MNTRILTNSGPLLVEISKLKGKASQVYGLMWTSAKMHVKYDKKIHLPWEQRRDCGGTTNWTIKGMADHLGLTRRTTSNAVCILLDNGFVTAEAYVPSIHGSEHTIFRVTHPNQLENVRHAISVIGSPSAWWRKRMKTKKQCLYKGEIYDTTEVEPTNHWKDDVSHFYSIANQEYEEALIEYVSEPDEQYTCEQKLFTINLSSHVN